MAVGQLTAYPEIKVIFETLARTAIQRSERGILVVVLKDATDAQKWTTLKTVADLDSSKWTATNLALLQTAFEVNTPYKVLVRRQGAETIDAVLKELETLKFTHLACPELESADDTKVVAWAKGKVEEKGIVYASAFSNNADNCAIIEINNKSFTHQTIGTLKPQQFSVMLLGAVAGCALNRSLDNMVFPTITAVDNVEPVLGKFLMYNDDGKVRVKLAINSKTTYDSTWKSNTRFIKIFEGLNIVRQDIQTTFKDYWCGVYMNSYDNKMAFCNLVTRVYFKELAPNVLSADYNNYIDIDEEANYQYIITEGLEPDTMSETEIRTYPTGEKVFLKGDVRFANTMISLTLKCLY